MTEYGYVGRLKARGSKPYKWHTRKDCSHGPGEIEEKPLSKLKGDSRFKKCTYCAGTYEGPKEQNHSLLYAARNADPEEVFND